MKNIIKIGILLLLPAIGYTNCDNFFYKQTQPIVKDTSTVQLCYRDFTVLYSPKTVGPVWSAEHVTKEQILNQKGLKRTNSFHPEPLIIGEKALLSDYINSGWDRGHMTPSADMPSAESQYESFSLANMIPQNSNKNEQLWRNIEATVRKLAVVDGEIFIITGPIYEGKIIKLNGKISIPNAFYKAVYDQKGNLAGAYISNNISGNDYQIVSLKALDKRIGANLFPSVPTSIKATAKLPKLNP